VAYVEQSGLKTADAARLQSNLAMAREMGAEVHCLKGVDFVQTLLDFARQQRITQLFLGHSGRTARTFFGRTPIDRLIDGADGFDVRLFPHRGTS